MNGFFSIWMIAAAMGGASADGQWHNDYAQSLAAARADNKPLLVVLHKPNQPSEAVRQVSHVQEGQPQSLNGNYHLCQIDVSTEDGRRVAQAFRATSFPYTVITDKQAAKIIYRKVGSFSDGEWTTTLADYRRGVRPIAYGSPLGGFGIRGCPTCR